MARSSVCTMPTKDDGLALAIAVTLDNQRINGAWLQSFCSGKFFNAFLGSGDVCHFA